MNKEIHDLMVFSKMDIKIYFCFFKITPLDANLTIIKLTLNEASRFVQIMQLFKVETGPKPSFLASLCLCLKEQRKYMKKIKRLKNADSPTEDDMSLQVTPRGLSKAAEEITFPPEGKEAT